MGWAASSMKYKKMHDTLTLARGRSLSFDFPNPIYGIQNTSLSCHKVTHGTSLAITSYSKCPVSLLLSPPWHSSLARDSSCENSAEIKLLKVKSVLLQHDMI